MAYHALPRGHLRRQWKRLFHDRPLAQLAAQRGRANAASNHAAGTLEMEVKLVNTPDTALDELIDGNARFRSGEIRKRGTSFIDGLRALSKHEPRAAIFCCSDARIVPEIIFDAPQGDIFAVRTGGAVLDTISLASLEIAVSQLSVPLIIVMGHQDCKSVSMALSGQFFPGTINTLTSNFALPIAHVRGYAGDDSNELITEITKNHIHSVAGAMPHRSMLLSNALREDKLKIIPAFYSIEEGRVEFYQVISRAE